MSRVDIILPVFRAEAAWVRAAAGSVRAQTHEDWLLHVVDDACPDRSWTAVVEDWPEGDDRLQLHHQRSRTGQIRARAAAIGRSGAPWIALIDQDDVYEPEKLSDQVRRAEAGAEVVSCDVAYVDPDGSELIEESERRAAWRAHDRLEGLDREALLCRLFAGNVLDFPSTLFSRAAYGRAGGYDTRGRGGEDWGFWLDLAAAGASFAHLPRRLYRKRLHDSSDGTLRSDEVSLSAVDAAVERRDRYGLSGPDVDQRIRDVRRSAARSALRLRRPRRAMELLGSMAARGQAGEIPGVLADGLPLVGRLRRTTR